MLFGEERDVAAGAGVHRRVEAGVLAARAALGRHLVIELVLDLHLVGIADLAEVQGDGDLPGLAMVDDPCCYFRQGVADLAGECTTVELLQELGGISGLDIEASPDGRCRWAAD